MEFKLKLAIDMDETIADTVLVQRRWLEDRYGYSWLEAKVLSSSLRELVSSEHMAALEAEMHNGEFFRNIPVMEGSQLAIERLSAQYDVYITSAAMEFPSSLPAKYGWLREHFPFINPLNFVFCGSKSIVNADIMIDDSPRHFEHFQGQGVLFSAPHNLREKRYPRLAHWGEAGALIELILNPLSPPVDQNVSHSSGRIELLG